MDAETLRSFTELAGILIGSSIAAALGYAFKHRQDLKDFRKRITPETRARVSIADNASPYAAMARLADAVAAMQGDMARMERERDDARTSFTNLQLELETFKLELEEAKEKIARLLTELDRSREHEATAETENKDLRAQLTEAKSALAETQADLLTTKQKVHDLERLVHELEAKGLAKDIAFEMLKGQFVEPLISMFQGVLNAQVAAHSASAGLSAGDPGDSTGSHPGSHADSQPADSGHSSSL